MSIDNIIELAARANELERQITAGKLTFEEALDGLRGGAMNKREGTPGMGTQSANETCITNSNNCFDNILNFGKPLTVIHEWQEYQDDQPDFLRWCQH